MLSKFMEFEDFPSIVMSILLHAHSLPSTPTMPKLREILSAVLKKKKVVSKLNEKKKRTERNGDFQVYRNFDFFYAYRECQN